MSPAHVRLIIVGLMAAFSTMNYFDRTIMSIAGPEIMKEFGLAPAQLGVVYSAFLLSYALFMMPGGQLVDRIGPKRALGLMGFGAGLFTGLTAIGARPGLGSLLGIVPSLVAIRFLMGVFTAPLYPACGRMCAQWIEPTQLGRVQGIVIGASALGGAIAPILFQALMSRVGWRNSFAVAAVATAGLAGVWMLATPERAPVERRPVAAPWRRLLGNRDLLLITASYSALGYFSYIFYYWIYYYFGEIRHMGFEQSARFTTLVFVVNGMLIPLGGMVSDRLSRARGERFGRRVVPIAGLTLSAILLVAGTLTTGTWTTVLLMAFSMGLASMCEGPFWAMAIRIGGDQVGAACSILNTGANLTGLIAPVLTPLIASVAGWSWGLYFGCFVVLLGAWACHAVKVEPEIT